MSLRSNYLYNLIGTLTGILYPLITFPYAARVLGVDGIGQILFFNSIIAYVGLFANLGIPMYAVREIAKIRDNRQMMANTTAELLLLHILFILLGYILITAICLTAPQVTKDATIFLVLSASLFLNAIGCDWFFAANEDFRYITVRGVIVRIVCLVMAGVVMLIAMLSMRTIGLNDWQNIVAIPLTGLTVYATILLQKKDFFLVNLIKEVVK